ncbi:cytochrome P450 [Streptomyces spectabilis]|uniref:Cytochrome P450 n=1 Tax=Streptomyces spectabilis TaxID=68270 RepID=A0A5P2X634_STRST|nr:cytochrome P450 [Streptomyces spectabilis]
MWSGQARAPSPTGSSRGRLRTTEAEDHVNTTVPVPRSPGALPLVGHLLSLARDPMGFIGAQRRHGPLVRISLGRRPAYVITAPALARQVQLDGSGEHFDMGGPVLDLFIRLVGDSLPTCPAAAHRRQRPILQQAFHHSRMPGYAETFRDVALARAARWTNGTVIDAAEEMTALSMDALARTLFLGPGSAEAAKVFQRHFPVVISGLATQMLAPAAGRLPTSGNRRFRHSIDTIHQAITDMIAMRRTDATDHPDLLSLLLSPEGRTHLAPDDTALRDQLFGFLIGGIETTGSVMGWALHLLATHPGTAARAHNEIDDVLGGKPPIHDDLARLPLLKRIVSEVLRLYPPVWLVSRTTRAEAPLGEHLLPAGSDVFLSAYVLHRDPETFPDPDRFDPDRWTENRTGRPQRDAYMPFGVGARKCIGDVYGLTQTGIVLATLLQRSQIHPASGRAVRPHVRITQRPGNARIRLVARARAT